jgi:predicted AlkP superfamily pyrophosphatase or phosphodiesterase
MFLTPHDHAPRNKATLSPREIMFVKTLTLVAALTASAVANTDNDKVYKYVAAFSVDGMHSSDVEKYVALRPGSTIAALLKTAYEYTDCYTSAPSDSFPGVAAFVTGASPRTTGTEP